MLWYLACVLPSANFVNDNIFLIKKSFIQKCNYLCIFDHLFAQRFYYDSFFLQTLDVWWNSAVLEKYNGAKNKWMWRWISDKTSNIVKKWCTSEVIYAVCFMAYVCIYCHTLFYCDTSTVLVLKVQVWWFVAWLYTHVHLAS